MSVMIEPQQVVYKETFKIICPHKECKIPLIVVVERIKGGGTSALEVTHQVH